MPSRCVSYFRSPEMGCAGVLTVLAAGSYPPSLEEQDRLGMVFYGGHREVAAVPVGSCLWRKPRPTSSYS